MSDEIILSKGNNKFIIPDVDTDITPVEGSKVPDYQQLEKNLMIAGELVDDIILKKYLYNLSDMEVVPLDSNLKQISDIRIFKITQMVYKKDEFSIYKFASVFNSVQNLNCGVFIIIDSNGSKTDFYMGVRSHDNLRTIKSLKDTLKNSLLGQFPGVRTEDLLDSDAESLISGFSKKNTVAVSCVANSKKNDITDNKAFVQGLEKLTVAMQGHKYTAIILAKSTPVEQLEEIKHAYETIYTQLSPFANMQVSYGTNTALSISDSFSHGVTTGKSYSKSRTHQKGSSRSHTSGENYSESKPAMTNSAVNIGRAALNLAAIVTAPLTGGTSLAAAGIISAGNALLNGIPQKNKTKGTSSSDGYSTNESESTGINEGSSESRSDTQTKSNSLSQGTSDNLQLRMSNKDIINTLEKIDGQLKRINECESFGMWECAAYFLSDYQETAEMAAGTYKALVSGENSGIETSAINYWGKQKKESLAIINEYITNFIHPVFRYDLSETPLSVTASSLVSGNELAVQMGMPRSSVCGLPVIEHAEFGKEAIRANEITNDRSFIIGKIYNMGHMMQTDVRLHLDSLTMHTFVTGSTGSGKSNTVYEILNSTYNIFNIPFLVIEPAKGEYKSIFGKIPGVTVYGTNPKKSEMLKINPFSFPDDIHILEHLDRLVEIFNVCWPMYAAMPAILKEAIQNAYVVVGWNIRTSENPKGKIYPNFKDVLDQIEKVINSSSYSSDSKGDYSGALLTRVNSLTTGLNSLIFCEDELSDEALFDKCSIVDLSRVGSTETKALMMGLLIMKLNEYRMVSGKRNSPLTHLTVLEEAHNLLRRTSTEQTAEGSNLLGKSVEMLANSIAELRTYGEGFIIADQSPNLMDMSVIRNTNTKIILRLPDKSDRELVGYAASLNDEQIGEIAKLEKGVAAIYQNDWTEPVLVKVSKCDIVESDYEYDLGNITIGRLEVLTHLIQFMLYGTLKEKPELNVSIIYQNIDKVGLTYLNREYVKDLLDEYQSKGTISLWESTNYNELSRKITDIIGLRTRIENIVLSSNDLSELSDELSNLMNETLPDTSNEVKDVITECLMKDMSLQSDERNIREGIYHEWHRRKINGTVIV